MRNDRNKFGIMMQELRQINGVTMTEMAKKFKVSISFLSSMELGRRKIPAEYHEKISKLFKLSNNDKIALAMAIDLSNEELYVDLSQLGISKKHLLVKLARNINELDDDKVKAIFKQLSDL